MYKVISSHPKEAPFLDIRSVLKAHEGREDLSEPERVAIRTLKQCLEEIPKATEPILSRMKEACRRSELLLNKRLDPINHRQLALHFVRIYYKHTPEGVITKGITSLYKHLQGTRVELCGLKDESRNGQRGEIVDYLSDKGRLKLRMDLEGKVLSIKPENIKFLIQHRPVKAEITSEGPYKGVKTLDPKCNGKKQFEFHVENEAGVKGALDVHQKALTFSVSDHDVVEGTANYPMGACGVAVDSVLRIPTDERMLEKVVLLVFGLNGNLEMTREFINFYQDAHYQKGLKLNGHAIYRDIETGQIFDPMLGCEARSLEQYALKLRPYIDTGDSRGISMQFFPTDLLDNNSALTRDVNVDPCEVVRLIDLSLALPLDYDAKHHPFKEGVSLSARS